MGLNISDGGQFFAENIISSEHQGQSHSFCMQMAVWDSGSRLCARGRLSQARETVLGFFVPWLRFPFTLQSVACLGIFFVMPYAKDPPPSIFQNWGLLACGVLVSH